MENLKENQAVAFDKSSYRKLLAPKFWPSWLSLGFLCLCAFIPRRVRDLIAICFSYLGGAGKEIRASDNRRGHHGTCGKSCERGPRPGRRDARFRFQLRRAKRGTRQSLYLQSGVLRA